MAKQKIPKEILGYIKYEGKLVKNGYFDVRKSANSLEGIDEILRFFILQENPDLIEYEFEIPARITKGSWEVLFNDDFLYVVGKAAAIVIASKYLSTAVEQIAKNDFNDVSTKDIGIKVFMTIINVVKIAKHLGSMSVKIFDKVKFKDNKIGIPNSEGKLMYVSKKDFENYVNCPEKIFNKLVAAVEKDRELEIALLEDAKRPIIEKISIGDKLIFSVPIDENEILFPELKHGDSVELEGHITRGNQNANTIGFMYKGHILTCYPAKGNITNNKNALFTNCIIKGYIDRISKESTLLERKPRIRFTKLDILSGGKEKTLFDK